METHEYIEKLRQVSDLTRTQLARTADVTSASIGKYLDGKSDLGTTKFIRILDYLGISISEQLQRKLQIATGVRISDNNEVLDDLQLLFQKTDDINKKIIITTLVKALSKSNNKETIEAIGRLKKAAAKL